MIVFTTIENTMSFLSFAFAHISLNINDTNTLFATNTVNNCLYFASKVENEKSNTVNRRGMLLRIIISSFIPIRQVMTDP